MKLLSILAAATLAATSEAACTLTGTYVAGTDVSTCDVVTVNGLNVPAGVTLDFSKLKDGATITFLGTTKFGTKYWEGPLVRIEGNNLKVNGAGILDGQGSWYWPTGQANVRPKFIRAQNIKNSRFSGFTIKNPPAHMIAMLSASYVTYDGLTLDASAGGTTAKNTDGFDIGRSDHITITNNKVYNQDDCVAIGSGTTVDISNNYCSGGHGISIGSIGGATVARATTADGVKVYNNQIVNNKHGLRIKTIINSVGLVQNVNYTSNTLTNVVNGIAIHSDYDKTKGKYTGSPTSNVQIKGITINGLKGTATNLYDIIVNKAVASNWAFSGITVTKKAVGTCTNAPANIKCA